MNLIDTRDIRQNLTIQCLTELSGSFILMQRVWDFYSKFRNGQNTSRSEITFQLKEKIEDGTHR